jgi:ribosomal protein L22
MSEKPKDEDQAPEEQPQGEGVAAEKESRDAKPAAAKKPSAARKTSAAKDASTAEKSSAKKPAAQAVSEDSTEAAAKDAPAEKKSAGAPKATAKEKESAKKSAAKSAKKEAPAADEKPSRAKRKSAASSPEESDTESGSNVEDAADAEEPAVEVGRGSKAAASTPRRRVVRAQARYVRTSARKARMVCGHLRGKSVVEARAILAFTPREVARDWSKLLESALANAENNHELFEDELFVREAYADEGPTIKRFRPRAMGRATPIRKRTSHLTITLTPKP